MGRFILTPLQSFLQPSSPGASTPFPPLWSFLWAWSQQVGAASSLTPTPPGSCLQLSPAGHPPGISSHFHHSAPDLLLFLSPMPLDIPIKSFSISVLPFQDFCGTSVPPTRTLETTEAPTCKKFGRHPPFQSSPLDFSISSKASHHICSFDPLTPLWRPHLSLPFSCGNWELGS